MTFGEPVFSSQDDAIAAWRTMIPAQRLDLACDAYPFALDVARLSERRAHPDLSPEELAWRVTRRMQGDDSLGGPLGRARAVARKEGEEE